MSSFDSGQDFIWYPQQTAAATIDVSTGLVFVMGWDAEVWDYCRIDWVGLVMSYSNGDGNASFEGCLHDASDNLFPFIAVASAPEASIVAEFYVNKFYANTETNWYLASGFSIYLRGESGVESSSTGTLTVSYSLAKVPAG